MDVYSHFHTKLLSGLFPNTSLPMYIVLITSLGFQHLNDVFTYFRLPPSQAEDVRKRERDEEKRANSKREKEKSKRETDPAEKDG